MAVLETNAFGGQPVEVRSLIGFAAVGGDAFITEIVGHDENHIRLICRKEGQDQQG
jgi:hypothetical protein